MDSPRRCTIQDDLIRACGNNYACYFLGPCWGMVTAQNWIHAYRMEWIFEHFSVDEVPAFDQSRIRSAIRWWAYCSGYARRLRLGLA
jgi:hypothetical protein